ALHRPAAPRARLRFDDRPRPRGCGARLRHATLGLELEEVRGHRSGGELLHIRRMIRVDPLDEGLDGPVAGGEAGEDLLLALGPVSEVLAELGLRVEDDRTVTRIDRSRIAF